MATVEEHYVYAALAPSAGHVYGVTASSLYPVEDSRGWVTKLKDAQDRRGYALGKASAIGANITVEVVRRKITVITGEIEGLAE